MTKSDVLTKYVLSDERERQIYDLLHASDRPLSRLEIGRAVGLAKSPHLISILNRMLEKNYIQVIVGHRRAKQPCYLYSANLTYNETNY
jgi:hypothetical protein